MWVRPCFRVNNWLPCWEASTNWVDVKYTFFLGWQSLKQLWYWFCMAHLSITFYDNLWVIFNWRNLGQFKLLWAFMLVSWDLSFFSSGLKPFYHFSFDHRDSISLNYKVRLFLLTMVLLSCRVSSRELKTLLGRFLSFYRRQNLRRAHKRNILWVLWLLVGVVYIFIR